MTGKETDTTAAMRCPSPLILYGIDSRGKPRRHGSERSTPDSPSRPRPSCSSMCWPARIQKSPTLLLGSP
jgi:hypothetical protein